MSQQCIFATKVANSLIGCSRQQVILPPCSALVRHIWSAVSGCGLPSAREAWTYWNESRKGLPRWSGTGAQDIQGKAERAGPVQPGQEKAQGRCRLLSRTAWLKDTEKVKPCSFSHSDGMKDSGWKLEYGKFWLDLRKYFLPLEWSNTGAGA